MNAKELALSKLNASTKTIGMYIYGISIGMDFRDIAKILMSDTGGIITQLLNNNIFSGLEGYSKVLYIFNYFDFGPKKILDKFDINRDSEGNSMNSPLTVFSDAFDRIVGTYEDKHGNLVKISQALAIFALDNYDLTFKLNTIEKLRNQYRGYSIYAKEKYNLLIDFAEDYIRQAHIIGQLRKIYEDIKTLSEGAEEMRVLGRILSLNQGIKTNIGDLLKLVNLIERAIYDKTGDLRDLVDLNKFVFNEEYRQDCINRYEKVKHSFNIYDVVSTVPHFMGYLLTLAVAAKELELSYKFRSSKFIVLELSNKLNYNKEDKIIKGINNFIGDYLSKLWMQANDITIVIPAGNKFFDKFGNSDILTEDTPIKLGTDWGNATFRVFIENEVIPNLKKGILKIGSEASLVDVSHNKFIRDLSNDLLTTTISGNASVIYTLPINMLPRVDIEKSIFNMYKAEFNKLAKYSYQSDSPLYSFNGNTSNRIPLVDLFTYYAMIADGWKLGEKSILPILEDFQNTGIIDNFHAFESSLDKSDEILSLDDIDIDDIYPYVAPFESPYYSRANYIKYKNPVSKKYFVMRKLSSSESSIDENYADLDILDTNTINGYKFRTTDIDLNYFPVGRIESNTRIINYTYMDGEDTKNITILYDLDSGKINSVLVNSTEIDIKDVLTTIPIVKVNGIKKVNMLLLESIIKNKENKC